MSVLLVLVALPFLRPNLFGESSSVIGFVLVLAAAAFAVLRAWFEVAGPAPLPRSGVVGAVAPLVACVGLAYLWLMVQAAAVDPGESFQPAVQGLVLTAGTLAALAVVCRDPVSGRVLARGFVLVIVALCASYAVTVAMWLVVGVGNGQVAEVFVGGAPEPVYFPFTTTQSVQTVLDVEFPRFTGLGREPGWMAMYCAAAYFMVDALGPPRKPLKALLVLGLLGTISTAGFGVFVVVWAYRAFLRDRGTGISMGQYLRQIAGLAAMALAVWVATEAPVLGLSAKATQNETSLDERLLATQAGLRALVDQPLGGTPTEVQSGVNLVADIAVSGLPFVILVCAALILLLLRGGPASVRTPVVLVVLLTLLTSQPAKDSTWVFGVVVLACVLSAPATRPMTHRSEGCT